MARDTLLLEDCIQHGAAFAGLLRGQCIRKAAVVDADSEYATSAVEEQGLVISGFLSMKSEDRSGDILDPTLFDLDTYRMNPQLWVNHALWKRSDGNEVSVGYVSEIVPVQAAVDKDTNEITLTSLQDGTVYKTLPGDDFLISDKDRGLWIVACVLEPDVQALVQEKRLNAFSWQGVMYQRKSGSIASIDLYEASLVNVPAHQQALFRMRKSLSVQDAAGQWTDTTVGWEIVQKAADTLLLETML